MQLRSFVVSTVAWFLVGLSVFSIHVVITQQAVHNQLDRNLQGLVESIYGQVQTNRAILQGLAAHISSEAGLDNTKARRFAREVLKENPHIYMLEAAQAVSPEEVTRVEQAQRLAGIDDFKVRSFTYGTDRRFVAPPEDVPVSYPLVFMEPTTEASRPVLGLDVYSVPHLKEAIDRSRAGKIITASRPFRLVEGDRAFVLFKTVDVMNKLRGMMSRDFPEYLALLVIRADSLLPETILEDYPGVGINLHHTGYEPIDEKGRLFYVAADKGNIFEQYLLTQFHHRREIEVNGRDLVLHIRHNVGWNNIWTARIQIILVVIVCGYLLTLLYAYYRIKQEQLRLGYKKELQALNEGMENRVEERTDELKHALEKTREANQVKTEFLSRMSHEFLTPMNAILGFAQILKTDKSLRQDQREQVDEILDAGQRMLVLIDDMLELGELDKGSLSLNITTVPLNEAIMRAIDLMQPFAVSRNISVDYAVNSDKAFYVKADRRRLVGVLMNLVSNATKFNPGDDGSVWVECHGEDDNICIWICDNGPGIDDDKINEIFEPFSRVTTGNDAMPDAGIGLSVCNGLVKAMGGFIRVKSCVGQGTCFTVCLPRADN